MLASEILAQISEDRRHRFPSLEVWFPIDVRLRAYRGGPRWSVVIETFVFRQDRLGHDCVATIPYCFGNCLPQAPGIYRELQVTSDGPSGPLFDEAAFDNTILPSAIDVAIRENVFPVTTRPQVYGEAGIKLREPPKVQGYELFRLIAPACRQLFFATEAEIANLVGTKLPLLLSLHEWRHPGILESPASYESFQMIADAIASGDPSHYRPSQRPNTEWRHWPMAGTI